MHSNKLIIFAIGIIFLQFSIYSMDEHNEQVIQPVVQDIKALVEKQQQAPLFVAIMGCSAVGKTHFADVLKKLLTDAHMSATILHGDDFLNPDHFDPEHFHPRLEYLLMHSVIQKIKDGEKSVKKPTWQPKALRPPSKIEENFIVDNIDVVLFEGEFTACNDEPYDFGKYAALTIFLDACDDDIIDWCLKRGRDIQEGQTEDDVRKIMQEGLPRYRSYVQHLKQTVSYHIMKDGNHNYIISNK